MVAQSAKRVEQALQAARAMRPIEAGRAALGMPMSGHHRRRLNPEDDQREIETIGCSSMQFRARPR